MTDQEALTGTSHGSGCPLDPTPHTLRECLQRHHGGKLPKLTEAQEQKLREQDQQRMNDICYPGSS